MHADAIPASERAGSEVTTGIEGAWQAQSDSVRRDVSCGSRPHKETLDAWFHIAYPDSRPVSLWPFVDRSRMICLMERSDGLELRILHHLNMA
jgi:hypothetical protein